MVDLSQKKMPERGIGIKRKSNEEKKWTRYEYCRHLFFDGQIDYEVMGWYIEDFPEDPFNLMIQLWSLRQYFPTYFICYEISSARIELLKQWTCFCPNDDTMAKDIPSNVFILLLHQALLIARKNRDNVYLVIVENWLKNIEQLLDSN